MRALAWRNVVAQSSDWGKVFHCKNGFCSFGSAADLDLEGRYEKKLWHYIIWAGISCGSLFHTVKQSKDTQGKNHSVLKYLQCDSNSDSLNRVLGRFPDSKHSIFPRLFFSPVDYISSLFYFFFPELFGGWTHGGSCSCGVTMLIWQEHAYRAVTRVNNFDSLNLSPNSFPGTCRTISAMSHILTRAFNQSPTDNLAKTNTMTPLQDHVHVWTLMSSTLRFSKDLLGR